MATFEITIHNDSFIFTSEEDVADMTAAKSQGLKGALSLGSDIILEGKTMFAAVVVVSDGAEKEQFIVTIGSSPLK